MKLLLFSDLHCDAAAAGRIVAASDDADVVLGAGDFASVRRNIETTIDVLRAIETPTVVVPGNNESLDELVEACAGWGAVHVLHGSGVTIGGVDFYGLGCGVPVTPFGDWSFDLPEDAAARMLEACPEGAVLVSHSPPLGLCDGTSRGDHVGSAAVRELIDAKSPRLVVCGHIHDSWGQREVVGGTVIINAGPGGTPFEL